jgi:predicted ester cyclase
MKNNLKIAFIAFIMFFNISDAFSQAKKPTLMVVPSDVWCNKGGYMTEYDNQGTLVKVPNYKKALQENSDLLLVISKINELMAERGFPLKNLESSLKSLEEQSAEDALLSSKSGSTVNESPIDKLKKVAKADIWMQMTWTVNQTGPKKSITFNLQGLDAYTDKQIAGASGTGQQSFTAELPVLLEEAVLAHLDNFNSQLQTHFDDLFANGREVSLRIKTWDSFEGGLENEYAGEELNVIIESWMALNTVQGRFSTSDATENMMLFEQVRIPLYDTNNKAVDARGWARGLQKLLKEKYQLDAKLMMKGLGQAQLVIGEK